MSLVSAAWPRHCSGAMYAGVPSTVPATVTAAFSSHPSMAFARPKSPIFGSPSGVSKTLEGFKSRCKTPCWWAW